MKILLLIAAMLLVVFTLITSFAPFKTGLLGNLFPKYFSWAAGGGSISLLPNIIASPGQTFSTPVMMNTAGQNTVGVDIILKFDKSVLELTDIIPHPENSTMKSFLPIDFTLNPPAFAKNMIITQAKDTGDIYFSAMPGGPTGVFNGILDQSKPLATLQFKVLTNAPTTVNFVHTLDSTTDTNMVSANATELLSTVNNMAVNGPPITYPETSPNPNPKPGDIDRNNKVDIFDYNSLLTDFGKTGNLPADLDKDNKVGIFDYNILLTNFGQ